MFYVISRSCLVLVYHCEHYFAYNEYFIRSILHRTNSPIFLGNQLVRRFDVERKYENRFQRPNKIKNEIKFKKPN